MRKQIEKLFDKYRIYKHSSDDELREFVERIENAVNNLPDVEKELIEKRYMAADADYITDWNVYHFKMQISAVFYGRIRQRAFEKLSIMLNINGGD